MMAKCTFQMPDEFLTQVSRLAEKTDEIVPKVVTAGSEVVLAKVRSNLESVVGSGTKGKSRATGELVRSLGLTEARQDRDGNWNVKVGFAEPRSDGTSNAKIANIIEHGKHNQPPRPFLKPAKSASKDACTAAMKAKLEEEIGKI